MNIEAPDKTVTEIKQYAKTKGVTVFEGTFLGKNENLFGISKAENYRDFIDFIANSQNKVLALNTLKFTEDLLNSDEELNKKYKKIVGEIFQIGLIWLYEGFAIVLYMTQDWFVDFAEDRKKILEMNTIAMASKIKAAQSKMKELAKRFQKMKNSSNAAMTQKERYTLKKNILK